MSSVFTKIINGELPGRFIYRDDTVAAFLTIEPLAYGHTLIVPVEEVDKWTDLAPNVWCEVNEVAQSIGRAVMEAFDAERAGYVIAGFDVPHAHIHVFPTNTMADYDFSKVIKADETDPALMDEAAEKLRDHGHQRSGVRLLRRKNEQAAWGTRSNPRVGGRRLARSPKRTAAVARGARARDVGKHGGLHGTGA